MRDSRSGGTRRRGHAGGLVILAVLALAAIAMPATLAAQTTGQDMPPRGDLITANPFLLLFEWFNAEWEHRLAPNRTVGVSASHFSFDDTDYTTASALFRVYPQDTAPAGIFLGGRLGGHFVNEDDDIVDSDEEFAIGFGVEVGYTWLFGSEQDFALSLGAGVTRLFTDVGDEFLPNVRLVNVGWAF